MTRQDQDRLACLIATERAVWDARRQALVIFGCDEIPMSADAAIVLYGMALRHVIGRMPIESEAA